MARQIRIEYPGAMYHVMARGDRREDIFLEEGDREMFYHALKEVKLKYGIEAHGYVLMSNHYHLLLETPKGNLVEAMKWLQNAYTRRFNVKHKYWGHLFGGRYKAIVIDDKNPEYFGRVLDYIHLNPARINWKSKGQQWTDYPYSSLRDYVGVKRPEWLKVKKGFEIYCLKDGRVGRKKFLERLEGRVKEEGMRKAGMALPEGQSLQSTLLRGWQFGNEDFRERMIELAKRPLQKMRDKRGNGYGGVQMQDHGLRAAERLFEAASQNFQIGIEEWARMSKGDWRKCLVAGLIQEQTGMKLEWICQKLKMGDRAYACRGIGRVRRGVLTSREMQKHKNRILMSINHD